MDARQVRREKRILSVVENLIMQSCHNGSACSRKLRIISVLPIFLRLTFPSLVVVFAMR
jgi:hypothetical protein